MLLIIRFCFYIFLTIKVTIFIFDAAVDAHPYELLTRTLNE